MAGDTEDVNVRRLQYFPITIRVFNGEVGEIQILKRRDASQSSVDLI